MKATLLFIFSALFVIGMQAQQSLNSSGGQASGSGGSASYSVGQVVYSTYSGSNGQVNEGVQQPYEFFTVSKVVDKRFNLEMTVYPNPVQYILFLKVEQEALEAGMYAVLYDLAGAQVYSREVNGVFTELPVDGLAKGAYLLRITGKDQEIRQSFKIIKN